MSKFKCFINDIEWEITNQEQINPVSQNTSEALSFLSDWFSKKTEFIVKTSGSTGDPKEISIERNQMVASARATGQALNLKPRTKALCCLPISTIAGKMMIVRAIVLELELYIIEPTSTPNLGQFEFTALTPMLFHNAYQHNSNAFKTYENIILGGGLVSKEIIQIASGIDAQIYHSYGMTETVSHIALRKLNHGIQDSFHCLPGIIIGQTRDNCLTIKSTVTANQEIVTTDIVELKSSSEFKWLGRNDNVINSGGLKIHPEQHELDYSSILKSININNRFYITSKKDPILGEALGLVIESSVDLDSAHIKNEITNALGAKYSPKFVVFESHFETTRSGKIIRSNQ